MPRSIIIYFSGKLLHIVYFQEILFVIGVSGQHSRDFRAVETHIYIKIHRDVPGTVICSFVIRPDFGLERLDIVNAGQDDR